MTIANTILNQLGGNAFIAMTGASHFVSDGNTLRMNLPRNMSKANKLYITLTADDLYTMRFFKFAAGRYNSKTYSFSEDKTVEVELFEGVYCDQLQELFTRVTGMYTRL